MTSSLWILGAGLGLEEPDNTFIWLKLVEESFLLARRWDGEASRRNRALCGDRERGACRSHKLLLTWSFQCIPTLSSLCYGPHHQVPGQLKAAAPRAAIPKAARFPGAVFLSRRKSHLSSSVIYSYEAPEGRHRVFGPLLSNHQSTVIPESRS